MQKYCKIIWFCVFITINNCIFNTILWVYLLKRIVMKGWLCDLTWISFVAFTMLLGGCSENIQEDFLNENNITEMYIDSVFLGFEGDLIYPEVIWGNVAKREPVTTMALALPPILFLVTVRKCSTMICVFCAKLCGCKLRNLPRALFALLFS